MMNVMEINGVKAIIAFSVSRQNILENIEWFRRNKRNKSIPFPLSDFGVCFSDDWVFCRLLNNNPAES
jgi:hypothetical protein